MPRHYKENADRYGKDARYYPDQTITDGTRDSYRFTNGEYMPKALVDLVWNQADSEGEIIED